MKKDESCAVSVKNPVVYRPVKRGACTSPDTGGDSKRSRVALKSLRACKIKVPAAKKYPDKKCSAATVRPEFTYSPTMDYFEQLCQRVDLMEPTGTQDSGPNARNPQVPSAWYKQLVEWMLNVRVPLICYRSQFCTYRKYIDL